MMDNYQTTRYVCPRCEQGGAGRADTEYTCHRCGYEFMRELKLPGAVIINRTSKNSEKPSET